MPVKADKDLKLYYSIGEVAEMFGVNDTLLRFWEREFPQIAPKKGARGIRQYTKRDIETVRVSIISSRCAACASRRRAKPSAITTMRPRAPRKWWIACAPFAKNW